MAGMVGTAGFRLAPLTGEAEADLPWWAVCGPPTTGGAALLAIIGSEIFLVALA